MKVENVRKEGKWLLVHLRPYLVRGLCGLCLAVAAGLTSVIDPLLMRHLIDHALPSRKMSSSFTYVILIAFCFIGRSMFAGIGGLLSFRVAQNCGQDLRQELLIQMSQLSADWHERVMLGEKMSRLDTDVEQIAQFAADAVNTIVRVAIFFGVNLVIMLKLNVPMTLAVLPLLPIFYAVRWKFKPLLQTRAGKTQAGLGMTVATIAEHLGAMPQLHLLGADESRVADSVDAWLRLVDAQWRQRCTEVAFSVSITSVLGLAILFVLGVGSREFILGAVTLGTVVAFYAYVTRIFEPISLAMELHARSERMLASTRRVLEVINTPPTVPDSGRLCLTSARLRYGISVAGVSFSYTPQRFALRDINLQIGPGETVAIIGRSGSGKSTLARLFVRLADPTAGSILVEGRPVPEYTLRSLRDTICYVPQSPVLFRGTIRENLLLANPVAKQSELDAVIEVAQLAPVVRGFSRGLDHALDAGAGGLSGGERQRLALARALLRPSAVLILDEASSALDIPTEAAILHAFRQFRPEMTFVLISHRVKSLSRVDRFILLEAGEIAAVGDHSKLQRESWLYRALFDVTSERMDRDAMEPMMSCCEQTRDYNDSPQSGEEFAPRVTRPSISVSPFACDGRTP
jgi:ABC-type bacteriocin/lantibiotic exporter with double-glycine peptidase domain